MKIKKKKIVFLIILVLLTGIAAPFQMALAQNPVTDALGQFGAGAVNYVANALAYLLAQLASVVFVFAGFFTNAALDLNSQIAQSPLAQNGWVITRDIANLGFVLVIVIIAVTTILRVEQYGVKKLLPKLIAAAILVNFSFAIAGMVIDFSNILTNFFYSRVATNNFGIATNLAGAFNPQALGAPPAQDAFNLQQQENQTFLATVSTNILKLVFIIVFTFAGALTLLTLALMLLIRYVHLIFLLIIAPIVWLFWVFPGLGGEFTRWWKSFFRWSFFAPASAFFLYLALVSVSYLKDSIGSTVNNGSFGGSDTMQVLNQGAQMIVLVGIMLGGIIIANEMGITGALAALNFAKRTGGNVAAWAGQKGVHYGTAPLRLKPFTAMTDWMQKRSNVPLVGVFKNVLVGSMGAALNRAAAAGERLPDEEAKSLAGLNDKRLAATIDTLSAPGRIAALNRLRKNNTLDLIGPIDEIEKRYKNKSTRTAFERFGLKKDYMDFEKATGESVEMREAREAGNITEAKKLGEAFFASFTPQDFAKLQTNLVFKSPDEGASAAEKKSAAELQEIAAHGMIMKNPGGLGRVISDAKGVNLQTVIKATQKAETYISETLQEDTINQYPAITPDMQERHDALNNLEAVKRVNLATRRLGGFSAYDRTLPPTSGTAVPPPAAPPPSPGPTS